MASKSVLVRPKRPRRNPYAQKFWDALAKNSNDKTNKCLLEWEIETFYPDPSLYRSQGGPECVCSRKIQKIFVIRNTVNGNKLVVGSCCLRRIGRQLRWKSKRDYLMSALCYARNPKSVGFVKSLIDKEVKYEADLKVSVKQKAWLESMTGKKWRWATW